jgi:chromate reductase, NAD(P)H dehydrogenase (quinone)
MLPLNKLEVLIATAQDKFDDQGRRIDATTRDLIRELFVALANWTRRLRGY